MTKRVPRGWAEVSLGDVVSRPRPKVAPAKHLELPFIGMDHIAPNGMELLGSVPFGTMKSNGAMFFEGDVLYGRMRPYLNKVHRAKSRGACSAEFLVFPKSEAIDSDFLAYTLHHRAFVNFASARSSGDRPRVDFDDVSGYEFALPPMPEQKRIVSRIDELFSRIDEGEHALEQVQKLVEHYRQSVLKATVTGELTREWRKRNGNKAKSGDDLLTCILEARRDEWEQAELHDMRGNGVEPVSDSWKKRYKEPPRVATNSLPALPEGWVWGSLPLLCAVAPMNGISIKGSSQPPGIPALRLDALRSAGFDYEAKRYIPIDQEQVERLSIRTGDFFLSRANGTLGLVGRAVLAQPPSETIVFPDTMIRYRLVRNPDYRTWLSKIWGSRLIRDQIERRAKTTAGIYKISQRDITEIAIPLPPPEEQETAISMLEERLSEAESLFTLQSLRTKAAATLKQAILTHAFAGQLVA